MFDEGVKAQLKAYFSKRTEIAAVIVFGSQARGQARADSDIDFGILLAPEDRRSPIHRSVLITDLMRLCQRSEIDVAILNDAPPLLLHRVLRDGHVLYTTSNKAVAEFAIRAFQQYEDTRPLRRLQAEKLRRHLRDVLVIGADEP